MAIALESITPSADQATDVFLVRRGAGPLDYTIEFLEPSQVRERLGVAGTANLVAVPGADQADWSPAGFDTSIGTIKAQPTTNSWVTGLVAGAADQEITLLNDSLFVMCFECESATSTAANRFAKVPDTLWLLPAQTITFRYEAALSRWVVTNQSFPVQPRSGYSQALLPGSATTIQTVGRGASSTTATLSHISPTGGPTNDFLEYGYVQGTNSTAAGTTSMRSNPNYWMRGSVAGRQGFVYTAKVRFTALGATGAVRAGMTNTAAASTTLNAALTHCVLLGADTSMTTLRIFRGDAAAGTPIDLGANFPVPSATAAYEVMFYAPTNSSFIRYMVRRLDTRFVAEGSLTANLPGNTQPMGQRVEAMVGATAVANTWQAALSMVMGL